MQMLTLLPLLSLFSPLVLSALARAAPSDVSKRSQTDVTEPEGQYEDVSGDSELSKRLGSSFVRIGRPSSFVRIGRGSHFVRIGRPGNFVRIGRGYEGDDLDDVGDDTEGDNPDKRASKFVRIGKASRFVRIGKSGQMDPEIKRMSSFVRIGKADPYAYLDSDDAANKRQSSFVRIGRIPSSAFVRIGRNSGEDGGESGDFGTFDRIARMGQSSFVRIGKREADPEKMAAAQKPGSLKH
ncbi:uncharacterized protein LOC143286530 isoform X2 [Babylonia areolata]|uniref:uncharacterized protein LOC143286530 isoform X2 n=1 Tax=Babylonia areolata TaxID=304850 RepID=UPI003FD3A411